MQALQFSARGISICIDLSVGHIADMIVQSDNSVLRPLHRAPWLAEPAESLPEGVTPGLARLSGDFLCAPFSLNDIEPAPGHGWTANSSWSVVQSRAIDGGWQAVLQLDRKVFGATIIKRLTLRDDHPFLYQEHELLGGSGPLPVAHHVMSRMAGDGLLSFSPKRAAVTPETSLEPDPARGNYQLAYPARSEDVSRFPAADGTTVDLTQYCAQDHREDFVVLVEAAHEGLGWTTLARKQEGDLVLVLKDPRQLPVTMLWMSNGGRSYAPWNNRHLGVLGIEDARSAVGHASSAGDNFVGREGVPTSFALSEDGVVSFRHVLGVTPLETSPRRTVDLRGETGFLIIAFEDGTDLKLPFDDSFLT